MANMSTWSFDKDTVTGWDFSDAQLADMGLRSVSVTPDGAVDRVRFESTSGQVVHIMLRGEARQTGQREALWLAAQDLGKQWDV